MIAALYVQTGGCYFGLPGVDPWDQARDAQQYSLDPIMLARHGYEYARRCGITGRVGGKFKKDYRAATPPEFRDLLLSIARTADGNTARRTQAPIERGDSALPLLIAGAHT